MARTPSDSNEEGRPMLLETGPNTAKRTPRAKKRAKQDEEEDPTPLEEDTDDLLGLGKGISQGEGWPMKGAKWDVMSPVPPQGQEDFWIWISNFTNDAWVYIIVYLWRTDPMIDSKFGGRGSNIRKITAPFTLNDIKLWEGSGGYRLDVIVMDQQTRKQARIAQHYFEIMDPDYPPRLPPGMWLEIPENKAKWGWVADALKKREETAMGPRNSQEPSDAAAIIRETVSAFKLGQPPAGTQATDQLTNLMLKQLDPENQAKLFERFGGGGGKSELVAVMTMMMKSQDDRNERLEKELSELRAELRASRQAPAQPTLVEQMKQQVELKTLARQLAGKEAPEDPWSKAIESALTALPTALALWQGSRTAEPTAATTTINTTAVADGPTQEAPPTQAQASPQPPPQSTGEPSPTMAAIVAKYGTQLVKHQSLLGDIVPIMKDHFRFKVGEGAGLTPGQAFASWFLDRFGDEKRKELIADLPIEAIAELIGQTPNLAVVMNPKEDVVKFLNDFNTHQETPAA